jgi:hypothetical protein
LVLPEFLWPRLATTVLHAASRMHLLFALRHTPLSIFCLLSRATHACISCEP